MKKCKLRWWQVWRRSHNIVVYSEWTRRNGGMDHQETPRWASQQLLLMAGAGLIPKMHIRIYCKRCGRVEFECGPEAQP